MPSEKSIIDQMLDRQQRMFRIAQDPTRYGLTLKMIAADADLGYDSVRNYAAGETQMPVYALAALVGVIPDELLSLLLPTGRQIVAVPDDIDHDAIAEACQDFLRAKAEAHREDSPEKRDIASCERATLNVKAARLKAVA
jgi:hypothetical protein